MYRSILASVVGLGLAGPALAAPGDTPTTEELAQILRGLLVPALPDPLVEEEAGWGKKRKVANGITWEKKGILLKPRTQYKHKNDGTWRRVKVEAIQPEKTLMLTVSNVQKPEKGKLIFDVEVTLQTRINFHQQIWKAGHRLYSGETRARCRPILKLRCESTTRTVKTKSLIPDVVFRMRVLDAKLTIDDLEVDHTAGIGGDAAKLLGEAVYETVKQVRPSIERKALEKANKAIIKAGDTKEVKLSLGKLLDGN